MYLGTSSDGNLIDMLHCLMFCTWSCSRNLWCIFFILVIFSKYTCWIYSLKKKKQHVPAIHKMNALPLLEIRPIPLCTSQVFIRSHASSIQITVSRSFVRQPFIQLRLKQSEALPPLGPGMTSAVGVSLPTVGKPRPLAANVRNTLERRLTHPRTQRLICRAVVMNDGH